MQPSGEYVEETRRVPRAVAEQRVVEFERRLGQLLESVNPDEFIPAATLLLRRGLRDPEGYLGRYPPHFMIHAMEACCAYWRQWKYKPLDDAYIERIINHFHQFDDPVLSNTIAPEADLFEFIHYMHRTQMSVQGEMSIVIAGKFAWLFGRDSEAPAASTHLRAQYGWSLRDWHHMAFAVYAGTSQHAGKFKHEYAAQFPGIGVEGLTVQRFLEEISGSPAAVRSSYRSLRSGDSAVGPLTWAQRRPFVALRPLFRLALGFVAPSDALVSDLLGDSFVERLFRVDSEPVRAEVGKRFERYVADLLIHHLPNPVWTSAQLAVVQEGRACDLAVDLGNCLLLIECKAVTFERDVVTRNAVITSRAIERIVDGYEQIIETARRIKDGRYRALGIPSDKPCIGAVVTLGEVPVANHSAVWTHAQSVLRKRGCNADPVPSLLSTIPQALTGNAIEYLAVFLKLGKQSALDIFHEQCAKHPLVRGEWEHEMAMKCRAEGRQDLSFWSTRTEQIMSDIPPE